MADSGRLRWQADGQDEERAWVEGAAAARRGPGLAVRVMVALTALLLPIGWVVGLFAERYGLEPCPPAYVSGSIHDACELETARFSTQLDVAVGVGALLLVLALLVAGTGRLRLPLAAVALIGALLPAVLAASAPADDNAGVYGWPAAVLLLIEATASLLTEWRRRRRRVRAPTIRP